MMAGCVIRTVARWMPRFMAYTVGLIALGAIAGTLFYCALGPFFVDGMSARELAKNGVANGAFLAFIWAPGGAFVICVMQAHRRAERRDEP